MFRLFSKKLSKEEFEAYFDRLPDKINVSWFRDGKFIIGEINVDGHEFMTQAISANEFIDMVNNTLLSVYEIPKQYFSVLLKYKKFMPSQEEFSRLDDVAVKKSVVNFEKEELVPALT